MATMALNGLNAPKPAQGRTTFGSSSGGFLLRNHPVGVKPGSATVRSAGLHEADETSRPRG